MRIAAMALGVAMLAGCATAYQSQGISGGFTEMRRGDDVYLIRFQGNGFTSDAQTEEMAFLRAAELTLEKGFRYFTILNEDTRTSSNRIHQPGSSTVTGSIDSYGNYRARVTSMPGYSFDVKTHQARLLIGVSMDRTPGQQWITAQSIVEELGPKYKTGGATKPAESCARYSSAGRCAAR